MKTKALFTLMFLLGTLGLAQAQGQSDSNFKWPENKKTAVEKNAYYSDAKDMGNFREAANALYWLLVNAPDLNPAIYINGAEIYSELADKENDAAKKQVLQDSVLTMYDLRVQYFGNEADVLDRKAFYAYKYDKDEKDKLAELYDLLTRVVELNGNKTSYPNAVALMDVVRRHKLLNKAITDEKALEHYDQVMEILDYHAEQGVDAATIDKYKGIVDDMLVNTVTIDCQFVEKNFGPKMEANPEDLDIAKKVVSLLKAGNCFDTQLFLSAVERIHAKEPSFQLAELIAKRKLAEKDYAAAEKYYDEAVKLTDDPAKRGEIYFDLAQTFAKLGRKSESRSMAFKAIESDPNLASKAYTHVGNLYLNSQECYNQTSLVEDRSIYLAAHKMYQKAGNTQAMAQAAKQFPSGEEIFNEDMQVGDQIKVGCWINETVTLQKR